MRAPAMSVVARTREWFLLRDLESRAAKVPGERRVKTSRLMRLSEQRRSAAEALWIAGFPAEGLRLVTEALSLAREAISTTEPAAEPAAPMLDDEVKTEDAARFRALLAEHARLTRDHQELALDTPDITRKRRGRAAVAAVSALALVTVGYFVLRTPRILKATSSANYDGRYDTANALDGNESTDWLLPDRTPGWIELQVIPPRKVSKVKLLNARNLPFSDRATNEFKVEAFSAGKLVKSAEGKFDGFSAEPTWRTVDVQAAKVDRIRIEVKSFHVSGGGFAEIEVD